jgi:hypothetical protein
VFPKVIPIPLNRSPTVVANPDSGFFVFAKLSRMCIWPGSNLVVHPSIDMTVLATVVPGDTSASGILTVWTFEWPPDKGFGTGAL